MPKKRARKMSPQEGVGVEVGEPDAKAAKGEQASRATKERKKAGRKAKGASSKGKGKSSGAMAEKKATAGPDSSSPTDEEKQTEVGQSPAAPSNVARSSAASEVTLSNGLTSVPTGHPPAAGAAEALQLLLQAQRASLSAAPPAVPPPVPTQALLQQLGGAAPTPSSTWPHAYIQQAYLQQQLPGPHQNQPSTAPQLSASSMTPWALAQLQLGLLAQNGTGGLGGALRPPTTAATAANPPLLPATSPQEQLLMYQRLLQGQLPVPPHQQLAQAQAQAPQGQHPSPEALLLHHLSSTRAQPPSHLASSLQLQQLGGLLAQNRPASLPPAQAPAPAPGSAALASASLTSRPLILQGLLQQSALKSQLSALVLLQRQQHALAQTPSPAALGSLLQAVASGTDDTPGTSGAAKTSGTESPSDQSSETAPAPTAGLMANLAAADLAAREQIDGMMKTKEKRWMVRYEELIEFRRDHGHCCVPHGYSKNRKLSWWVMNQRAQYQSLQQGKKTWLSDNRVRLLEAIDFDWAPIISKSLNR